MRIVVMDGQGGNIGRMLARRISEEFPQAELLCVGTNSIATANMLKGGCARAATGENAAVAACRKADVLIGPIGIVIADALLGEVTEKMAAAVGRSDAVRILLPLNRCDTLVAGVADTAPARLIEDALAKLRQIAEQMREGKPFGEGEGPA